MRKFRESGGSSATWLVLIALVALASWLVFEAGTSVASGVPELAAGSAAGDSVLVVAGQVTRDTYGLYIVDQKNQTICIYQWLPGSHKLRLMAARTYIYDRELDEYNTEPSPREIRDLVRKARRLKGPTTRPE